MIKEILQFKESEEEFKFLATFDLNDNFIKIAQGIASARQFANIELDKEKSWGKRKDNFRTYFMGGLTEGHFSLATQIENVAKEKERSERLKVAVKQLTDRFHIEFPAITISNHEDNRKKDDYLIKQNDYQVTFDLKSQYLQNKYRSVNINVSSLNKVIERDAFFIFAIISAEDDTQQENYTNPSQISYYMAKNEAIKKYAKKISPKDGTPFYSLSFNSFM